MILSYSKILRSILLAQSLALALAVAAQQVPAVRDRQERGGGLGASIRGLGRYVKDLLAPETRQELHHYGSYGKYGKYGSYGSYAAGGGGAGGGEAAGGEASATTTVTITRTTMTTLVTLTRRRTGHPGITECHKSTSLLAPLDSTLTCIIKATGAPELTLG